MYNQKIVRRNFALLLIILFTWACQSYASPTSEKNSSTQASQFISVITNVPTPEKSLETTPMPTGTKSSNPQKTIVVSTQTEKNYQNIDWMKLPVIPDISNNTLKIYHRGIEMGNHPNAFSKVGDCGSTPSWFFGDFDRGPRYYNLGKYTYLQKVIDYYHGSFDRTSLAALAGYNTSSVLTPLWSDKNYCQIDESPLECEYRIQRPSIALITLGANDVYHLDSFEEQLRKIIEITVKQGIIPVLATKPDNKEGNHQINQIIASLAIEYDIPLWNYWLAVQPLPNHGLQEDGVHITFAANDFSNPINLEAGWPVRNLTALQVLYALYTKLNP
ncbi:MAG: SGNH/GDSL hydrolase family protein [Anaerolineales bacterium]